MTTASESAVAVYLDFDNIVISRYDQVHGKGAFWKDRDAGFDDARLKAAEVDVHAILDYASSFGRLALTRAYADWSLPVNARYRKQLVDRAIDLIQLFPASGSKNGADIRLAVDALEDASAMTGVGTIVLGAGDSDFIPLAQRLRRMGKYVVAVGVAGATSRSLAAAVDAMVRYDDLPGLEDVEPEPRRRPPPSAPPRRPPPRRWRTSPTRSPRTTSAPPPGRPPGC